MNMENWAENECRLACKRENPEYDFDNDNDINDDDVDYVCSCYKSALKAYNSMYNDNHSGYSWHITRNILIRLIDNLPLTPITEDDFVVPDDYSEDECYTYERNVKRIIQCPRCSSLFRYEMKDGTVKYHDNNRAYFINIENLDDTYRSSTDFLDELYPITLPYYPSVNKYKIYAQSFLVDEKNGDYDTKGIIYMITPDGTRINLNIYMTEVDNNMVIITRDEYDKLLMKRIK